MSYLKYISTTKRLGVMIEILYHLEEVGKNTVTGMEKALSEKIPNVSMPLWVSQLERAGLIETEKLPFGIRTKIYKLSEKGKKSLPDVKKFEKEEYKSRMKEALIFLENIFQYHPER